MPRILRRLRDMLDVDASAIGNGKIPVYRTASGKHEYETVAGGASAASGVSVVDAGGYFTGTDLEAVTQELGADVGSLPSVYQPLDSDLTAIAALATTAFGRALLALADQAALLSAAGAAAASHVHSGADITSGTVAEARIDSTIARDSEVTSAISALSSVYQPLDSDLTAIAALTTTAFGRAFLALADAAAARTAIAAAPLAAKYIVQTADSELSAEQALGALATGLLKNTTTTGVLSIAAAGTDYYAPGSTDVAVADGGTGSSTAAGARTNLDVPSNAEAVLDALYDAHTILKADSDNTPAALTMGASTILARLAAGNIVAATVAEVSKLLGPSVSRQQAYLSAMGCITETCERKNVSTASVSIMVDGTCYYLPVYLYAGETVTGIDLPIATGGATVTVSKVGLADVGYAKVGASADQGTAWQTAGAKRIALTSPYSVPSDGIYHVAIIAKASTLPTLFRGAAVDLNLYSAFASEVPLFRAKTGQTDIPSAPTGMSTSSALGYYVRVY